MTKLLLSSCIVLLSFFVSAQSMKFSGVVNDTINQKPLSNVVVMAVNLSDSVLMGFTRTNANGEFLLTDVEYGEIELLFTHPNFADKSYYIIGSEENDEIHIPNVILPGLATELQEVVIYANKEPIYYKGDTLVYVADSFNVKPNAVVEDLLKRLPGIEVDDEGNIQSQGQEVSKVLVDGDEFFGDDPTVATKNLNADGVETVEVYETTEDTGDGEETIQVMDVRLKEGAKNGYFGKIAGATDFDNFYEGEFLANKFKNDLKVSVFALASNTPNTGFNRGDAFKFGLTNEMNMGYGNGVNVVFGDGSRNRGLPRTFKGGFYFNDKLSKNLELGFNYTYNNNDLQQNTNTNSQYVFGDTNSYSNEQISDVFQNQESHSMNLNLEWKIDSLTTLFFEPSLNISKAYQEQVDSSDYLNLNGQRTSGTYVRSVQDNSTLDFNSTLRLLRKFKKKRRSLEFQYEYGLSESDNKTLLNSDIRYFNQSGQDSLTNQNKVGESQTQGHRAYIEYVEPITKTLRAQVDYRFDYFYGDQSRSTYNINGGNQVLDSVFSNNFSNTRMENRIGVSLRYETVKQNLVIGTDIRNVQIDNFDKWRDTSFKQSVDNFLPSLRYVYKFDKAHRLRLNYTTDSRQPSLNQLQPIPDNTNPNNVYVGNPDLKPTYAHRVNINYNKWNALTRNYYWMGSYFNYTNNDFSNEITYLADGRTQSKTINVDGNLYAGVYGGGGVSVWKKWLTLRPNVNLGYSEIKSVINVVNQNIVGLENITRNTSLGSGLDIEMDFDSLRLELGASLTYTVPKSTFGSANQPYFFYEYSVDFYQQLPWKMEFETDLRYSVNTRRAAGFNINPVIVNASLGKRFLKTENLKVEIIANDIFNQNVGITRDIRENVIIDQRTQVIARYFLLKATLRFNNTKSKEDEGNWGW